jgi:hypothetical protein
MDELIKKVEERYIEHYCNGLRIGVIFDKLTDEFGISYHSLYKRLNVKELKQKAEDRIKQKVNS